MKTRFDKQFSQYAGIGHTALMNYCKCPITQQIQPQGALEEFACFEFASHLFDDYIYNQYLL
jgi:hypothetical protein